MTSTELENLVRIGKLKREPPSDDEIPALLRPAEERLTDAARTELSYSSRFDFVYNAAHALALVAPRRAGYRSDNRYLVFQSANHCLRLQNAYDLWRTRQRAADIQVTPVEVDAACARSRPGVISLTEDPAS